MFAEIVFLDEPFFNGMGLLYHKSYNFNKH
jgi:hypothetical protein